MKRIIFVAGILAIATFTTGAAGAAETAKLAVFAAASLREAFEAAAPVFLAKTGITVTFNFGGSNTLAAQIIQGAPADVFASANATQMQKVASAGLLSDAAATFARNRLVVIVPQTNPGNVKTLADLARPGVKVVLAAPNVPAGNYARSAFAGMSGQTGFPGDFAAAVEKNVVSNELDVKAVVTKVALAEAEAGVAYVTDVTPGVAAKITSIDFPAGITANATYPIAALKAAANEAGAQSFVRFILGDGQAFLKARGFLGP